jgi:DNA polymerase-3 subunit delta'
MRFTDIYGHEDVKERLKNTVKDQRVSHAQLFLGPEGSGNLALAVAYAQYINCRNRTEDDSCGTCPSCIKYAKLAHPDLHFIYPVATNKEVEKKPRSSDFISQWRELLLENNLMVSLEDWVEKISVENKQVIINADDCSEINRTLNYKSYESEYKVMIIWMAEKIFYSAAPKILKILEEPPGKTLFMLIAENQDLILPTILSRTQLVKIIKFEDWQIREMLVNKCDIPGEQAARISNLAEGNFVLALKLLNEAEDENYNYETFRDWMRLCYKHSIIEILSLTGVFSKLGREKQKNFLNYCLRMTRLCFHAGLGNNSLVKLDGEAALFSKNFSKFINQANVAGFADEFQKAVYHIERNANPSILFLDLSFTCINLLKQGVTQPPR